MDVKSTQSHSMRVRIATISYFIICLLIYGIGALILDRFPGNMIGNILVIFSGLLIMVSCPGLLCSFSLFDDRYTLTEHIIIGFGLNLLILPLTIVLMNLGGLPVGPKSVIIAIALLTSISAAFWIGLNRSAPSAGEVKATLLWLSLSALCLLAVLLVYPREIFTPIDLYSSDDSMLEIADDLTERNAAASVTAESIERRALDLSSPTTAPQAVPLVYVNGTSQPRPFIVSFLTNCGRTQLSLLPGSNPAQSPSPAERTLKIEEIQAETSQYLPPDQVGMEFLDTEFPDRNRVYVSETLTLSPGENRLNINCLAKRDGLRVVDLSAMDRAQILNLLPGNYLIKAEPEIGDAQEAFLESKYALDKVSWINPPLLYPIYRTAFVFLGTSMSSIALLELFLFSLMFMLLCVIGTGATGFPPLGQSAIAMLIMINYAAAMTIFPVLHSAASVFLLMFLAGSWFLWRRQFVPAIGAFILASLIRYEGVILASVALFAFAAVGDYQIRSGIRKYLLSGLAAVAVVLFLVAWVWGAAVFQPEALVERIQMMGLANIGPLRILQYVQWALVMASGIPVFWIFARKTDRLFSYFLLIALLYLGFLCSLNYVRPYHFGPFVFAAAAAGMRALAGVGDAKIRQMAIAAFFALALGSAYLIQYQMPRQLPWPIPETDAS